jgi:hypothetical protein
MEYLGAWGTPIHDKNLKSKISCQTPFKRGLVILVKTVSVHQAYCTKLCIVVGVTILKNRPEQ